MNRYTKAQLILLAAAPLVLSGCFKTREEVEREQQEQEVRQTMHKNIFEASEGLQQTQQQVGRLQGRLEESEHNRKKEADDNRRFMASLSDRLQKLEERLANSEKLQADIVEEFKKMKEEHINALSQATQHSGKKNSAEKNLYKLGIQAVKAKQYKEGVAYLQQYLEANPKAKTAVEAHFQIGNAEFAQKNWAEAIVAYSFVFEKNQSDASWKRSTLRIAESFQRLGKKKDARPFAQALVDKYPDSNEAKAAKRYLN